MSLVSKIEKLVREESEIEMCTIDCDMSDEVFMHVAQLAHERDITFNQMVVHILEEQLAEEQLAEEQECDHENTVFTCQWGFVCKDCETILGAEWRS